MEDTSGKSNKSNRDFKKGISVDDNRRRREANSIKLRKEKREDGIAKKRNIQIENFTDEVKGAPSSEVQNATTPLESIKTFMVGLHSQDPDAKLQALRGFRRLLSSEKNPPVQQCLDSGAVPLFVNFLQRFDSMELQFEAAWVLTNIASTEYTRVVVESGAVPHLVALLSSPNPDIREQSAWCLGNVAGDGADLRDYVMGQGALPPLLANITQPSSLSLLRNCVWSLSNFCRGKPQPQLDRIQMAIPVLSELLKGKVDQEVLVDASWALSYISDGHDSRIQAVVDANTIPSLIEMLNSNIVPMIVPALRTLGNIASGNEGQTEAVIAANVVPSLANLLSNSKKNIRKETCWMLSNIAAGTHKQMNSLFKVPELIPRVIEQLSASSDWEVRKEAAWVISNIITTGHKTQIMHLVEMGAIKPICDLLEVGEVKIVMLALESLEAILAVNAKTSNGIDLTRLVDEAGGVDGLERLQEHENQKVYERAVHIIEKFFGVEEDQESENLVPSNSNSNFTFGMPAVTGKASIDFNPQFMAQQQVPALNNFQFTF